MIPFSIIRPALFQLAPETAHDLALNGLSWAGAMARLAAPCDTHLPSELLGYDIDNPVGLAAGLDKNGDHITALGRLGFGFIEVGTITPRPQAGNPKPRLFRIPQHQAIINRMGFNNKGVDHLVKRLKRHQYQGVLGVNIGKNKDTPNEHAVNDYIHCLQKVYPYADYITVNLSSPNTVGLRDLQAPAALDKLLQAIIQARDVEASEAGRRVPLVLKVAPDLNASDIPAMANVIAERELDGIIATNTSIQRPGVENEAVAQEAGGLSGAPIKSLADETLAAFNSELPESIQRIGCGGITCGQDAVDKLNLGAKAVQIYSGFVYHGPELIQNAIEALRRSSHFAKS